MSSSFLWLLFSSGLQQIRWALPTFGRAVYPTDSTDSNAHRHARNNAYSRHPRARQADKKVTIQMFLQYLLEALLYYLLHVISIIYPELIFEYGLASFLLCMCLSNWPNIVCWRDFPIVTPCCLCQRSVSTLCFTSWIYVSALVPMPHCLDCCIFVKSLNLQESWTFHLVLFCEGRLGCSWHFLCPY